MLDLVQGVGGDNSSATSSPQHCRKRTDAGRVSITARILAKHSFGLSLSLSSCDFYAQIDPNAKLIYNDNKAEGAGLSDGRSRKADAMYDMLKGAVRIYQ